MIPKFTVIIPARYSSERLPGKPLAEIGGIPMIQRVYQCAQKSSALRVVVATDDQRIVDVVNRFGGEVCLTSDQHPSGTDRLQEVVSQLDLGVEDIVVNVQGDEPLIPAAVIDQVAKNLSRYSLASAATLSEPIDSIDKIFDPNVVKVVADNTGYALYFSRASIPWVRDNYDKEKPILPSNLECQRHIGIYAYRVGLLNDFVTWAPSPLEVCERLEQLRIMTNGHRIHVAPACDVVPGGVDTPEDLARINRLFSTPAE